MSLSDALNEIKEDAQNIEVELATENIQTVVNNDSKFKFNLDMFDKKVIDKFNNLYQKLSLKESVKCLNKIDYKIAQEVFTMIDDVSKAEQAKLTTYPSILNKEVLDRVLSDVVDEVPDDVVGIITKFITEIEDNLTCIDEVRKTISIYSNKFTDLDKKLVSNKPIVIYDKNSYNLYTDKLLDLLHIDDTKIDYDKFSGILIEKYDSLSNDSTLEKFFNYYELENKEVDEGSVTLKTSYTLSLSDIVNGVIGLNYILDGDVESLLEYIDSARSFIGMDIKHFDITATDLISNLDKNINVVKRLQMLHSIVETKNNFIEKVDEILTLIDQ